MDPIDEPAWDTAHNVIPQVRQKEVYALKANHINANKFSLSERLTRFNAKTIADELTPYCTRSSRTTSICCEATPSPRTCEEQRLLQRWVDGAVRPKRAAHPGEEELQSPVGRPASTRRRTSSAASRIPKVAYHPKTLLTQMQQGNVTLKQIGRLARAKPQSWEQGDFYEG